MSKYKKDFIMLGNKTWKSIIEATEDQNALVVYIALLSHRNRKSGLCFPSKQCLADEVKLNVATVAQKLAMLKEEGFITWTTGTWGEANQYSFPFEDSGMLMPVSSYGRIFD